MLYGIAMQELCIQSLAVHISGLLRPKASQQMGKQLLVPFLVDHGTLRKKPMVRKPVEKSSSPFFLSDCARTSFLLMVTYPWKTTMYNGDCKEG
jgi:hypothetical protein